MKLLFFLCLLGIAALAEAGACNSGINAIAVPLLKGYPPAQSFCSAKYPQPVTLVLDDHDDNKTSINDAHHFKKCDDDSGRQGIAMVCLGVRGWSSFVDLLLLYRNSQHQDCYSHDDDDDDNHHYYYHYHHDNDHYNDHDNDHDKHDPDNDDFNAYLRPTRGRL
ncbi:hypothetical protein AYO20_06173 [Fonsecaea nubica]|uniref:Uncharacterized protein n=1 Tax=Fonsecaea nubica TaxID=856822 RepID=A0A178CZI4_9EURO|nr:hypothetical protein AYO20_06173 [Fonsecaea nubica]OAL34543.1 hypothetical protein AYO20_06173 [Fonsecaea nubica]